MTVRFEKPAAAGDGYESTPSGRLWKVTLPEGEWRDVVLLTDPGDPVSLVVLSNNSSVSPRVPARKAGNSWSTTYGVFGDKAGSTMLEAKEKPPGSEDLKASPAAFIQVSVDSAGQPSPSGAGVTLRTKSRPPTISASHYFWPTEFVLQNANRSTNGFIVQKVNIGFDSADPREKNTLSVYWEAWRVINGRVFSGLSKTELSLGDAATSAPFGGHRGTHWHRFEARFMPNYTEPESWSTLPEAGPLPATRTPPSGWMSLGTARRSISVDFDGTKNPTTSTVTFLKENF